ncbi:hypothetical protein DFH08DRAFT_823922 [Mycena albidolilacea]|uniref:Uncharacterized protein n=1 Tax=Mycena albidolilacea TaxID=1033008 RepID=A0AAD7EBQ1_9AGAR|nr:hypothetical protein DFH08DRAFT_823922 [Mycena albidolilacea]
MTRLSATFLVAVLATFVLKANAAPIQLPSSGEIGFDFSQNSQCADTNTVVGLLNEALNVLDQIQTNDNQVLNDLNTIQGFLATAIGLENSVLASCNSDGFNSGDFSNDF